MFTDFNFVIAGIAVASIFIVIGGIFAFMRWWRGYSHAFFFGFYPKKGGYDNDEVYKVQGELRRLKENSHEAQRSCRDAERQRRHLEISPKQYRAAQKKARKSQSDYHVARKLAARVNTRTVQQL